MRILLIEDDKQAAAHLVKGLNEAGFNVEHAPDGRDGLFLATSKPFGRGSHRGSDRKGWERLLRYCTRPIFASENQGHGGSCWARGGCNG